MIANQPLMSHERQGYVVRGSQWYRGDSVQERHVRERKNKPLEEQDMCELVYRARGGDREAEQELRRRDRLRHCS